MLDEARGELAWVVPVPRGGWLETGDDHWFEALDEATAAVIAPHKSLECGGFARESTAEYRSSTAPRPISSGFASLAPSAAIEKLTSLGFVVDASTRANWTNAWGFELPAHHGWTAAEMVDASARGDVDVFWQVGGNFLETLAHESHSRAALSTTACITGSMSVGELEMTRRISAVAVR